MGTYTVWEQPGYGEQAAERALLVRDGFSWLAVIFGPLWLLFHRMFVVLLILLVGAGGLIALIDETLGEPVAGIVGLGLGVWFAFEARGLRRWALARRGWQLVGIVEAANRQEAERRYFASRSDGASSPGQAAPSGEIYPEDGRTAPTRRSGEPAPSAPGIAPVPQDPPVRENSEPPSGERQWV